MSGSRGVAAGAQNVHSKTFPEHSHLVLHQVSDSYEWTRLKARSITEGIGMRSHSLLCVRSFVDRTEKISLSLARKGPPEPRSSSNSHHC